MAVLVPETTASSIPSFLSSYLLLGSTCATLYLLGCFIYNLYFHPLRRYPGPVLARCSRLWYTFYFVRGKFHLATQRAHEKYGDVVRVAPDELSYIATSAWKDIYGHRAGKPEMSKDPVFYANILSTGSLVTAPRERHGFIRRQLAHSFSASALREQESLVESYADLLIFKLSEACEKGSKPVNMVAWYNYYTFDVISDLAFGESFGCLKSNNYHPWVSTIVGGVKGSLLMKVGTHYPLLKTAINKLLVSKAMIEKKNYHRQMTVERLDKRLQQSTDRTDFLVKMVEPDSGVSHEEMLANASLLTVAGSETTATLLSALTYLLLKNPGERRKLREELESAFQSADQITCESTRHQPYLAACLEEGLRLFPPLPTSLPRKTPVGGDYIDGAWVPEDTTVSVTTWPAFRSPKHFKDPDLFVPERWMGDEKYQDDERAAFQPFSTGPRNCLGVNLAYSEARLAVAKMIWHFDLELIEGTRDWQNTLEGFFIWYKTPLMVKLKPIDRT